MDIEGEIEQREFLAAFESARLPEERFRHADHVLAAWILLGKMAPAAALARFTAALKNFAVSLGKGGLYHETITWAYLLLINERMERMERTGRSGGFQEFADANGDLLTWRPSILEAYYRQETLQSDLARRIFVLPDRLSP